MVTKKKLPKERVGIANELPLFNKIVILMLRTRLNTRLNLNKEPCTMDELNENH